MLIDTHVHTYHSDGLHSPQQVVADALSNGIGLLSITDHDCVEAYPAVLELAKSHGLRVIPGVELTTMDELDCSCIHVVGLGIETDNKVRQVLDKITRAREEADRAFLDKLNRYFSAKYEGWLPTVGAKPGVFQNMMANAKSQGISISEKEMMDVFLNPELWAPIEYEVTLGEAVSLVKEWGGVPVLAHPFDFSNDVHKVLGRFLEAGGEAVELCKYRYKVRSEALSCLSSRELLAREREMNDWTVKQAREHGLKLTMASDYHDGHRDMGMDPDDYGIDVSWLDELLQPDTFISP